MPIYGCLYFGCNYLHEIAVKNLFVKNVLPEKCKENMQTKQPRFKLQLKKTLHNSFSEIFSCNDIRNGYIMKVVFESNCKVDY